MSQALSIKRRDHENAALGLNVELVLRIGHIDKESPNLFAVAQAEGMAENPVRGKKANRAASLWAAIFGR